VPRLQSVEELLRWLDGRLSRPHDRAVFNLPAAPTGPDGAGELFRVRP
jgi:hypothetical protein